jgi:peptide deformylase
MALLNVARLGNPVLRRIADPVSARAISSPDVQRFIDDLIATMFEYDGVGLAAPQVHVSSQIVAYALDVNPERDESKPSPVTILINPRITPLTDEMEEDWEGCLSVPDLRGLVPRYTRIEVAALGRDGKAVRFEAEGFHARVVQHECDHLAAKVYLDRMRSMESLSFVRELVRYQRDQTADDADVEA